MNIKQNQFQDDLAKLLNPYQLTYNPWSEGRFVGFSNGRYTMQTWLKKIYPEDDKVSDNPHMKTIQMDFVTS